MNSLMSNSKTIKSIDLSTVCPRLEDGNPCVYCYVQASRAAGFRAKTIVDRIPYNDEIQRMKQDTVSALNSVGGLRLFAFADYKEWMDDDLSKIIKDANDKGLLLKAITKQLDFILKYHQDMNIINLSIDNVGCGVEHEVAKEIREEYTNVKIRSAIMKDEDVEAMDFSDIFTFNHARNNGFKLYSKKDIMEWRTKLGNKVCCVTGKCATCELKCGLGG